MIESNNALTIGLTLFILMFAAIDVRADIRDKVTRCTENSDCSDPTTPQDRNDSSHTVRSG
jgi:hypothetical protein